MTYTNTLHDPRVAAALDRMFAQADRDDATHERIRAAWPEGYSPSTAQESADANAEVYMPISAEGGRLLYNLVRSIRPASVIEFGTSHGISTLYLAAAVRDNGVGHVISTEMSAHKAAAARKTFAETGLDDLVTILDGDARQTLADYTGSVDFVCDVNRKVARLWHR